MQNSTVYVLHTSTPDLSIIECADNDSAYYDAAPEVSEQYFWPALWFIAFFAEISGSFEFKPITFLRLEVPHIFYYSTYIWAAFADLLLDLHEHAEIVPAHVLDHLVGSD